ncbi:hypothetical protein THAOC_14038, partial [Thalassiosira oceanica]
MLAGLLYELVKDWKMAELFSDLRSGVRPVVALSSRRADRRGGLIAFNSVSCPGRQIARCPAADLPSPVEPLDISGKDAAWPEEGESRPHFPPAEGDGRVWAPRLSGFLLSRARSRHRGRALFGATTGSILLGRVPSLLYTPTGPLGRSVASVDLKQPSMHRRSSIFPLRCARDPVTSSFSGVACHFCGPPTSPETEYRGFGRPLPLAEGMVQGGGAARFAMMSSVEMAET